MSILLETMIYKRSDSFVIITLGKQGSVMLLKEPALDALQYETVQQVISKGVSTICQSNHIPQQIDFQIPHILEGNVFYHGMQYKVIYCAAWNVNEIKHYWSR